MSETINAAFVVAAFATGVTVLLSAYVFALYAYTQFLWWRTMSTHRREFAKWHWVHCSFGKGQYGYAEEPTKGVKS